MVAACLPYASFLCSGSLIIIITGAREYSFEKTLAEDKCK
jgi:hypothetical protein